MTHVRLRPDGPTDAKKFAGVARAALLSAFISSDSNFNFPVLPSFFLPAIMDMSNFSSAEQAHMTKVIEKRQVGSDSAFVRGRTR